MITRRSLLTLIGAGGATAVAWNSPFLTGLFGASPVDAQELPRMPARLGEGMRVAIIGAGVSGLASAYELLRVGFDVTVFEGTKRYGGRSLTVRPSDPDYKSWYLSQSKFVRPDSYCDFIPAEVRGAMVPEQIAQFTPFELNDGFVDLYFNAGPGRIPTIHTAVLHYCREFGIELIPFIFRAETNLLQADALNEGKPVQMREFLFDIQGHISEMLYESLDDLGTIAPGLDEKQALARLQSFLRDFGDLGSHGGFEGTRRAGYAILPGAGSVSGVLRDQIPLAQLLKADALWPGLLSPTHLEWQQPLLQPAGGMDVIWQAFLSQAPDGTELRHKVKLSSPVRGLRYEDAAGEKILVESGTSLEPVEEPFDYVIMTGSPPNLLNMETDDLIDEQTISEIRSLLFWRGGKYGWQARNRFWEAPGTDIFGGISFTSKINEQIWYPSDGWNAQTGILTGAYVLNFTPSDLDGNHYGPGEDYKVPIDLETMPLEWHYATEWAKLDHEERTEGALAGGEALHPGFRDNVFSDQGLSVSWDNQPYQFAISVANMYSMRPDAYARLIQPLDRNGRFYLAGDSVSFWSGWQEGAVRSAWWVLQKIFNHAAAAKQ